MTNRLALILVALLIGAYFIDSALNEGAATLFLIRRLVDLFEWMAFWR
ncbi:MAG: glyceraldehyde-3-phosphate dehydrogenase [Pseudomonadota bacterium]